ncbi:immunity 26/phosphotriesterase HocA family protein [Paenibacillus sp. IHB B 3084]|nr:immunity 26/phosphotriesterase HocA family protein [Paenibacillus sp. IHB B 3084]
MVKRIKHQEGDIFVIPMHDGRFANGRKESGD